MMNNTKNVTINQEALELAMSIATIDELEAYCRMKELSLSDCVAELNKIFRKER